MERIMAILEVYAGKMQTTATHLYQVLLKQVYIDACYKVLEVLLELSIVYVLYAVVKYKTSPKKLKVPNEYGEHNEAPDWHGDNAEMAKFLMWCLILILSIIMIIDIGDFVKIILNPDYYVIKKFSDA